MHVTLDVIDVRNAIPSLKIECNWTHFPLLYTSLLSDWVAAFLPVSCGEFLCSRPSRYLSPVTAGSLAVHREASHWFPLKEEGWGKPYSQVQGWVSGTCVSLWFALCSLLLTLCFLQFLDDGGFLSAWLSASACGFCMLIELMPFSLSFFSLTVSISYGAPSPSRPQWPPASLNSK